ncbi:MAG: porin family protein [Muribaculaceae bacterium]|nr:porin family protein [Muribaculaceae bacterium]
MRFNRIIILTLALLGATVALAQFRFGPKGGLVVSKFSFDQNLFSTDNRAGYAAGLQVDFNIPITGLAIDASVLYSHRNDAFAHEATTFRRDYIEIPVHLRYGLSIMGVERIVVPYAFTGPNFAFLCDESKDITWDNRSSFTSWDVGLGVELFRHLQLQASYGIGITEAFKYVNIEKDSPVIRGKDRCWTVTAAYLF